MRAGQQGRRVFGRRVRLITATVGGLAASLAGAVSTALASTSVPCSAQGAGLIAALDAANSSGGGTVNLAAGCTYQLSGVDNSNPDTGSNGLPVVLSPVTINGNGATIAGDGSARIIEVDGPGGNLTIKGLTILGGFEGDVGGGGILNHGGTLTLISSTISGNTALGGGGIATGKGNPFGGSSLTTLNTSRVVDNTANGGPDFGGGGGIANGGTLQINNSEIADNIAAGSNAGGLLNHGELATLNKTTVTGNHADVSAGGIANLNFGLPSTQDVLLRLNSSLVTDNSASGAGGILNLSFGPPTALAITNLNPQTQVTGNTPDNCEPPGAVPRCTS